MAELLARAFLLYVAGGAIFASWFVYAGANRMDPAARGSSIGFRVLIFPGAVGLWPYLLARLLSDNGQRTTRPHRTARHQRWHLGVWMVLGPAILVLALAILATRPPTPTPSRDPPPTTSTGVSP